MVLPAAARAPVVTRDASALVAGAVAVVALVAVAAVLLAVVV